MIKRSTVRRIPSNAARSPRESVDLLTFDPFGASDVAQSDGVKISESAAGFQIDFDVPGSRPEDVTLSVGARVLTVGVTGGMRPITRAFSIPSSVDASAIRFDVRNGRLTVLLRNKAITHAKRTGTHN